MVEEFADGTEDGCALDEDLPDVGSLSFDELRRCRCVFRRNAGGLRSAQCGSFRGGFSFADGSARRSGRC